MLQEKRFHASPFEFRTKNVQNGPDEYRFEGFASTFDNTDLEGDIIAKGAFSASLKNLTAERDRSAKRNGSNKLLSMLFNHDFNQPIGRFVKAVETGDGLEVEGVINTKVKFVQDTVLPLVEAGDLDTMSIGFIVEQKGMRDGKALIKRANLYEASLVPVAANPLATLKTAEGIVNKQSLETLIEMEQKGCEQFLRTFLTGTTAKKITNIVFDQREADGAPDQRRLINRKGR